MYFTIIIMPLLGSIISGFFGRKIGVKGSHFITCSMVILTTLLAIIAYLESGIYNTSVSLYLFKWVDTESLNVYWGFNFDSLTVSMLIPVLIVSSSVHIYSIGYMSHDPHNQRFFSYLSLFTFMMIVLVTANNYLLMFVGWEGVGICSYLLVSFWFTRIAANQSSISAILTNRVGDCLLTIGMFAIIWTLGNLDYATVFSLSPFINENIVTVIGICLLIGAMAKSSQVGLHVWLPMAMEGPTPVSALIHAATMVTAGVYLLIRSSPLIEYSSTVLLLCLWIGAITSVFSSLIGLFQQDIKKVIAYSTMSQLGLMVLAVGLSSYHVALFHLVNHAFYKALLFLGAGAVIHAVADNQDFRKYGGFRLFLPLSYSVMLIASLSLVAFPYMTGFFSKDFILESAYGGFNLSSITVYYIATVGAMFTTLYSVKTLYLTFITNPNGPLVNHKKIHEGNTYMSVPLVTLALFSIYFGFVTKDMFIGLGSDLFIDNSIFIHPTNEIMINTEFAVPTIFKLLPLVFTISLVIISLIISGYMFTTLIYFKFSRFGYNIFSFFNLRSLVEAIYNKYVTENILKLGGQTTRVLDRGIVEYIGPYGLQISLTTLSKNLSSLDTGVVTSYALYFLVGVLSYLCASHFSIYSNNLLIILLIIALVMINLISYKKSIKNVSTLDLEKQSISTNNVEEDMKLKSSILEYIVISTRQSIIQYFKNFNIWKLAIGVIKLKLITMSIAYVLCLDFIYKNKIIPLNCFLPQDIFAVSNTLIILLILLSLVLVPWTKKMNFSIRLILNIMIINIFIFCAINLCVFIADKCNIDIDYLYKGLICFCSIKFEYFYQDDYMFNHHYVQENNSTHKHTLPISTDIMFMDNNTGINDSNQESDLASSNQSSSSGNQNSVAPNQPITIPNPNNPNAMPNANQPNTTEQNTNFPPEESVKRYPYVPEEEESVADYLKRITHPDYQPKMPRGWVPVEGKGKAKENIPLQPFQILRDFDKDINNEYSWERLYQVVKRQAEINKQFVRQGLAAHPITSNFWDVNYIWMSYYHYCALKTDVSKANFFKLLSKSPHYKQVTKDQVVLQPTSMEYKELTENQLAPKPDHPDYKGELYQKDQHSREILPKKRFNYPQYDPRVRASDTVLKHLVEVLKKEYPDFTEPKKVADKKSENNEKTDDKNSKKDDNIS